LKKEFYPSLEFDVKKEQQLKNSCQFKFFLYRFWNKLVEDSKFYLQKAFFSSYCSYNELSIRAATITSEKYQILNKTMSCKSYIYTKN